MFIRADYKGHLLIFSNSQFITLGVGFLIKELLTRDIRAEIDSGCATACKLTIILLILCVWNINIGLY